MDVEMKEGGRKVANFERLFDEAASVISGSAADLIVDAHGNHLRWMHNVHAQPDDDRPAFLIGRGWSASAQRRRQIAESGIPAMAINDYPRRGPKPRYYVAGDGPSHYGKRIWSDPDVMKFCPTWGADVSYPREDAYAPKVPAKNCPNVFFYHQVANDAEVESWLHKPWISWGTTLVSDQHNVFGSAAGRSSMLCGMRLLWHLGYRTIFLVGCDCDYHPSKGYWPSIFHYLGKIAPTFERYGLKVIQTNPDAHLRTFPIVRFEECFA